MFGFGGIDPRITDIHFSAVALERINDVHHSGVTQVRAVLLEGQAQDQHARLYRVDAFAHHQADHFAGDVAAHPVVGTAASEDHVRVVTDFLRLVGQVIRIDADAVAAHQARAERQEVPLGAGGFQHFKCIDAEFIEKYGEVVDQGDVEVALGVLDDLGGFCHFDGAGLVCAGGDDALVKGVDEVGCLQSGARGDLEDVGEAVLLVARVDALGGIAAGKATV